MCAEADYILLEKTARPVSLLFDHPVALRHDQSQTGGAVGGVCLFEQLAVSVPSKREMVDCRILRLVFSQSADPSEASRWIHERTLGGMSHSCETIVGAAFQR